MTGIHMAPVLQASSQTPSLRADSAQPSNRYLAFRVGREHYGIDILKVQEIRSYDEPTRLFHAPAIVRGVVDLRGVVVPVVDLRMKFDAPSPTENAAIVVLNLSRGVVGVVVDAVTDVVELPPGDIRTAPQLGDGAYVNGIATLAQDDRIHALIVVDIECLMASPDIGLGLAQPSH